MSQGADKGSAKNDGNAGPMVAFENEHLEVVRLLLESGVDKDVFMDDA